MKKLFMLSVLVLTANVVNAQRMFGSSTSNWCGTLSMQLNPANIVDGRSILSLDAGSLNFGVDNNMASLDLYEALGSATGVGAAGRLLTFNNDKKFNVLLPVTEVRGPGFLYTLDSESAFALTTRARGFNQFTSFDQTLFRSIMDPTFNEATGYSFKSGDFNWTGHLWTEFNITYGRILYKRKKHFVKAAFTGGLMVGIGFLSVHGNNLDASYYDNDSLVARNTDIQFNSSVISKTGELGNGLDDLSLLGKNAGYGFRADIGAVYEYRPQHNDPLNYEIVKYKARGSIALTDFGRMKYGSAGSAHVTGNGSMNPRDLANSFGNYTDLSRYANSRGFTLDTGKKATKVGMPTAMVLSGDYYITGDYYVNLTWIANLVDRGKVGNSYYNQLTLTPRVDMKYFTFAIPVTYSALTKGVKAGLGMRIGWIFFGSDDMLVAVSKKQKGFNAYAGGYIPLNFKYTGYRVEGKMPEAPATRKELEGIEMY
jgi:hypothetical protein